MLEVILARLEIGGREQENINIIRSQTLRLKNNNNKFNLVTTHYKILMLR